MTTENALLIASSTTGFVSAIFFCISGALNTSNKILLQASSYWDFNEPLARALASQRAQYAAGALILLTSFLLQAAAALAPKATLATLPQYTGSGPHLCAYTLVLASVVAYLLSVLIYKITVRNILLLEQKKREAAEIHQTQSIPPPTT